MVYILIVINFILIGLVYFSFKNRLKPPKIPINSKDFPDVNLREIRWGDSDDHNQNVLDIINLVISEEWEYKIDSGSRKLLKYEKEDLFLSIEFKVSENENDSNKFKVDLNSFEFSKGYKTLFRLYFDSKNQDLNVKKLVHNCYYQYLLENRRKSESRLNNSQDELDQILINVKRDRRIDDILKK